ncbi:MAG TPA: hypothetical protein VNP04_22855 [Alphaproteobacteria bacterium]|nr:hypothetical protein [Alphaproteobacteria bacterium]
MRQMMAMVLTLALVVPSTTGWADTAAHESTPAQIGSGVGSVVGSAVYFPFKASFCILGGIGSGFALIAAGPQAANKVASAACRGTWAITPDIVNGKQPVKFVGDPPASARKP